VKIVLASLVPPGVVTYTIAAPTVGEKGTLARIDVGLCTVKAVEALLLNLTSVVPVKYVPVIVT
jgi:hypothetical protein